MYNHQAHQTFGKTDNEGAQSQITLQAIKGQIMEKQIIITAGSTYLDIDAYACAVAMAELLRLLGEKAIAYSVSPYNYSICDFLIKKGQIAHELPEGNAEFIIVDVSDPDYIKDSVPLDKVIAVYDHHVGFEEYWENKIGGGAHIEFIGAAATLIWREWKKAGLCDRISADIAKLLIAAILDNTLNLTAKNTTNEDIETFHELCQIAEINDNWRGVYFSAVQKSVEADLKNALFNDIKTVKDNPVLPYKVGQLCVWDTESVLARLDEIREWFGESKSWMVNIIDIKARCSYFLCDEKGYQQKLEKLFNIHFENGVAKTKVSYLRKEIIKKTIC